MRWNAPFTVRLLGGLYLLVAAVLPVQAQLASDTTRSDATLTEAFRVFRNDGQAATLDDVLAEIGSADVVFIGEQHDDPVAHYLQAELLKGVYGLLAGEAPTRPLALSLEMFERDVQPILDEYLADLITESHFLRSSRPWQNYETDYKPLVEFAKARGLPVLAANAPRRYVNRVSRLGSTALDTLPDWAHSWLPPLPYPGPSADYTAKWNRMLAEMMTSHNEEDADAPAAPHDSTAPPVHVIDTTSAALHRHPTPASDTVQDVAHNEASAPGDEAAQETDATSAPAHGGGYMLDAQAFWDAAMSYSIYRYLLETPGALVLHVGGSFHVEEGLGMPAKLDGYRPGTRRLIVVIKAVDAFTTFDAPQYGALGDFVILTDKSRPRTFAPTLER